MCIHGQNSGCGERQKLGPDRIPHPASIEITKYDRERETAWMQCQESGCRLREVLESRAHAERLLLLDFVLSKGPACWYCWAVLPPPNRARRLPHAKTRRKKLCCPLSPAQVITTSVVTGVNSHPAASHTVQARLISVGSTEGSWVLGVHGGRAAREG